MNKRINTKEGISLIVLVVTVIVMIIITGTIVVSVRKTNIIKQGKTAIRLTNQKAAEEAANIAISNCILETIGQATDAQLQAVVDEVLKDTGYFGDVIDGKVTVGKGSKDFIIKIEIGEAEAGQAISIPVMATEVVNALGTSYSDVTFNFTVDYGDGEPSTTVTEELTSDTMLTHTYNTAGEYTLTFSGSSVPFIYLNYVDDGEYIPGPDSFETVKVNEIVSWGDVGLKVVVFNGEHDFSTFPKPYSSSFKDLEMMTWINADASSHNKISSIPAKFFRNATKLKSVSNLFAYSTITSIPADIFEGCNNIESLNSTFAGCNSLTGDAPGWWNIYGEENTVGTSCFYGSTGLSNYGSIPPNWIADNH